jgi:hypothetical protein
MLFRNCVSHFIIYTPIYYSNQEMYTRSRGLKTLPIVYNIQQIPSKLQPENGFMNSRNMSPLWSCNYLLIIFYIIKVVLDYKIIYILFSILAISIGNFVFLNLSLFLSPPPCVCVCVCIYIYIYIHIYIYVHILNKICNYFSFGWRPPRRWPCRGRNMQ